VWGGGNTSIKLTETDYRGRSVPVLCVKGSGSDLKLVERRDFPAVRLDDIQKLFEREDMTDDEIVSYLDHALLDPGAGRPSIETLLHGFLSPVVVIHTHADAVLSLSNNDRPRDSIAAVYGRDVVSIPYRRPGFRLAKDVAQALAATPDANAMILERHGTITWGATAREAYESVIRMITRAEDAIAGRRRGRKVFGASRVPALEPAARHALASAIAPRLRGRFSSHELWASAVA